MLIALGYSVDVCSSAEEALEVFDDQKFDLVLVDMMMPKMNCLELIDELKSASSTVRTVIITGNVTNIPSELKLSVLQKPFDIQMLEDKVRGVI